MMAASNHPATSVIAGENPNPKSTGSVVPHNDSLRRLCIGYVLLIFLNVSDFSPGIFAQLSLKKTSIFELNIIRFTIQAVICYVMCIIRGQGLRLDHCWYLTPVTSLLDYVFAVFVYLGASYMPVGNVYGVFVAGYIFLTISIDLCRGRVTRVFMLVGIPAILGILLLIQPWHLHPRLVGCVPCDLMDGQDPHQCMVHNDTVDEVQILLTPPVDAVGQEIPQEKSFLQPMNFQQDDVEQIETQMHSGKDVSSYKNESKVLVMKTVEASNYTSLDQSSMGIAVHSMNFQVAKSQGKSKPTVTNPMPLISNDSPNPGNLKSIRTNPVDFLEDTDHDDSQKIMTSELPGSFNGTTHSKDPLSSPLRLPSNKLRERSKNVPSHMLDQTDDARQMETRNPQMTSVNINDGIGKLLIGYVLVLVSAFCSCASSNVCSKLVSLNDPFQVTFWTSVQEGLLSILLTLLSMSHDHGHWGLPAGPYCLTFTFLFTLMAAVNDILWFVCFCFLPVSHVSVGTSPTVLILYVSQRTFLHKFYPGNANTLEVTGALMVFVGVVMSPILTIWQNKRKKNEYKPIGED